MGTRPGGEEKAGTLSPKARQKLEDTWVSTRIGEPFPERPVRIKGEKNQFVAFYYHNGKPAFGRAWMEGGKVEAAFPVGGVLEAGSRDVGKAVIQILAHPGNYATKGFWYDWCNLSEVKKGRLQGSVKLVRCGDSAPVYHKNKKGQASVGNLELSTETVNIAFDGQVETLCKAGEVAKMLVPCMNFEPPQGGDGLGMKVVELGGQWGDDLWSDFRVGDPFPPHTVLCAGRPLNFDGTTPIEFSVALWYSQGTTVIGRAWAEDGKLQASFGYNGEEYCGDACGAVQLLQHHVPASHGFEYTWRPYSELKTEKDGWRKVHVKDIVPCVTVTKDGFERPGQLDVKLDSASNGFDGSEATYSGSKIEPFLVLARKDLPARP